MTEPNVPLPTPSQTVGPFFSDCLLREGAGCNDLAPEAPADDRIAIHGSVYDGAGAPVPDAVLELWQDGSRFGRVGTDATGQFAFTTVMPNAEARYISVAVFARGLLNHLYTRIYFPGVDPATDPVLMRVMPGRRSTLVARDDGDNRYRFDIVLQGNAETVFFDFA